MTNEYISDLTQEPIRKTLSDYENHAINYEAVVLGFSARVFRDFQRIAVEICKSLQLFVRMLPPPVRVGIQR